MRKLLTLSERQLVGCVTVDSTCYGGRLGNGSAFAADNATSTEDSYSYTRTKVTCSDLSWGSLKEVSPDSGGDSQQLHFLHFVKK